MRSCTRALLLAALGMSIAACGGGGGSDGGDSPAPPPTVMLSSSSPVASGTPVTLQWSSQNASQCTASGAWSGTKGVSGAEQISVSVTSTYTLACSGRGGTATATTTITSAVILSGVLPEGTYFAEEGPFAISGTADVAPNTTVVFAEGSRILAKEAIATLRVFGTLRIVGSAVRPVHIENINVSGTSQGLSDQSRIELSHCVMESGILSPCFQCQGSISVVDCTLSNLPRISNMFPPVASEFLRNTIVNSEGIEVALGSEPESKMTIAHNKFSNYQRWAIFIPVVQIPANLKIFGNSFLDATKPSIVLATGGWGIRSVDATGNYWGTTDPAVIASMVFDEKDDLGTPGIITFEPFLTAPDPNTPQ